MSGALVRKLGHAERLRSERATHYVKKIGERNVCRTLTRRAAVGAGQSQGIEVVAGVEGEVSVGDGHSGMCSFSGDDMVARMGRDGSGLRAALARARREALAGVQPRPVVSSATRLEG